MNNASNYRILLIDDTPSIHDDFREIFSSNRVDVKADQLENLLFEDNKKNYINDTKLTNIHLDSAYSGEEGLEFLNRSIEDNKPYAVAIVDVRMPGGFDGVETVSKIFKMESNIQIIFCSAYSDYDWEEMVTLLQHTDRWVILKKPFDTIEARQLAISLCDKWLLLSNMKDKIEKQTQDLKERIDELKKAEKEIKYLAYYDSLTDLPNRYFFKEVLDQSIDDAERNNTLIGLFFLDIDDFKNVNDTYGHNVGDELLQQVAHRLKTLLRKSDFLSRYTPDNDDKHLMMCSRLGGDEFIITLKNIQNADNILKIAERINTFISKPSYKIEDRNLTITASIGVAIYPTDAKNPETLLKNADIAMYQAKSQGKNRIVIHNKQLNKAIVEKLLLVQDIHQALSNHEFYLEYQPKVSIKDKTIIGSEALIRWKHPKRGVLQPMIFIPIAEESDLIVEIDKYVLENVCQQIQEWKKTKFFKNKVTSINVSARFLNTKNIVDFIKNAIMKNNISPKDLEIEITESCLLQSHEKTQKCLDEIHHLLGDGIKISIDDFGVGYSSLSYLNEFPINKIKIDRSFIKDIDLSKDKKPIIKAIIELSHSLKHDVIAEGVETEKQYQFLKEENCDEIQGFILAQAMPPEKLIEFIKNWDPNTITFKNGGVGS